MPPPTSLTGLRTFVERVTRVLDTMQRALVIALGVMLSASGLLLLWQVFDRMVLGGGQNWIEEIARLLLVWLTFLGAAVLMRERRHLTVEYFTDKLPRRTRRFVAYLIDTALLVLFTFLLTLVPTVWTSSSVLVSPSLGVPRTVLALAAFISYGISAVYLLESMARRALRLPTTSHAADDTTDVAAV